MGNVEELTRLRQDKFIISGIESSIYALLPSRITNSVSTVHYISMHYIKFDELYPMRYVFPYAIIHKNPRSIHNHMLPKARFSGMSKGRFNGMPKTFAGFKNQAWKVAHT